MVRHQGLDSAVRWTAYIEISITGESELEPNQRHRVGSDTVFVIPVGPNCREDFVADTLDSIVYFAPQARIIVVDDSQKGLGLELSTRFMLTTLETQVHGLFGNLYLNLSRGFEEALAQPFRILIRLDTDGLIAGSDFERKAEERFQSSRRLGSLGSFRIGYDRQGTRDRSWAKRQILKFLVTRAVTRPRASRDGRSTSRSCSTTRLQMR